MVSSLSVLAFFVSVSSVFSALVGGTYHVVNLQAGISLRSVGIDQPIFLGEGPGQFGDVSSITNIALLEF